MKMPIEFINRKKSGERKSAGKGRIKAYLSDRKNLMTALGCVAIIAVAVWANVALSAQNSDGPVVDEVSGSDEVLFEETGTGSEDYMAVFRAKKDATRAEELGYLEQIVSSESSDSESVAEAQDARLEIIDNMEKEMVIEGLIMAKGFDDVAVTVSANTVNVVVDSASLEEEQIAQILDITVSETGIDAANVKIMPIQ